MKVREIMTRKVVSCGSDASIAAAARLMLQGGFGTLPVVDPHGTVKGIITDRDIAMAAATRERNASHIGVHEAMSPHVRVCTEDDEIGVAMKQMEAARVRRLPVLDAGGHLAGILSIDDIVLHAVDGKTGIAPADIVAAMRVMCSRLSPEPEVNFTDTFVSG
jgi:CBS domain-containing protein